MNLQVLQGSRGLLGCSWQKKEQSCEAFSTSRLDIQTGDHTESGLDEAWLLAQ